MVLNDETPHSCYESRTIHNNPAKRCLGFTEVYWLVFDNSLIMRELVKMGIFFFWLKLGFLTNN